MADPAALSGIRVLDLGVLVQAPQAAATLADFGAEVIKVELPKIGDQSRWLPSSPTDARSAYWFACNRGKRSVTIDLRTAAGKDVFLRLADTADVVISNFKPGTLDEWGLGYEVLAARNPRVVYATGSAFGPVGPDAALEGADLAGQTAGGIVATTGVDGGPPTPVGVTISDHIASQHLTIAIMVALFHRQVSGVGQRVDVSLVGGAIWAQASEMSAYLLSGTLPRRANRGHSLVNGAYGLVTTSDGHIAIVGVPGPAREPFMAAIGVRVFDEPRFRPVFMSVDDKIALLDVLDAAFVRKTSAEWIAILRAAGVRCAPVRDYAEIADDPQVRENGYVVDAEHPSYGAIRMVGTPFRMSATPAVPGVYAPELGEHTEEILLELGYGWEEIAALGGAGAV